MVVMPTPVAAQTRPLAKWWTVGVVAANGLDLVTTEIYMADFECRKCHETNPLTRQFVGHPASLLAFKVAGTALQVWLMHKLNRDGHPTVARWLGVVSIGAPGYVGISNWKGIVR